MTDLKKDIANEADRAVEHPLVVSAMQMFMENMGIRDGSLPAFGLHKLASVVAQVARAQALNIDPDDLRLTTEEANEVLRDVHARMEAVGLPSTVIGAPDAN
jgi:hypothetical protein